MVTNGSTIQVQNRKRVIGIRRSREVGLKGVHETDITQNLQPSTQIRLDLSAKCYIDFLN